MPEEFSEEYTNLLSFEIATAKTLSSCGDDVNKHLFVLKSHALTVLSELADTNILLLLLSHFKQRM